MDRQLADADIFPRLGNPFNRQNRHTAHQQRPRHNHRAFEQDVDLLFEDQPQHHRWQKRDQHIDHKPDRCLVTAQQALTHRPERAPIEHDHGQNRPQLDHDVEHRPLVVIIAEQLGGQNQVAGGRHRQEFGQTFDNAKQDGGKQQRHGKKDPWSGEQSGVRIRALEFGRYDSAAKRFSSNCRLARRA